MPAHRTVYERRERAGSLRGRHVLRDGLRQVLREQPGEERRVDVGIEVTLGRPGEGSDDEMLGDVGVPAAERVRRGDGLALVECVGGDVDERLHIRVAGRRVRDDAPP